jgi:polyhydroxyalkanoate synthase subunit PhaE
MANTKNNSSTLINEVMEQTTKMVENATNNMKTFTKDMPMVNQTIEAGQKMYHQAVETQKEMMNDLSAQMSNNAANTQKNVSETSNFFMQWLDNSINMAKQNYGSMMNQGFTMPEFNANPTDMVKNMNTYMMQMMSNMMNMMPNMQNNSWMNNPMMNANNPMLHIMQQMNPMANMQQNFSNVEKYTKPYMDMMQQLSTDWAKYMPNTTSAESFKGMQTMADSYAKFFEMVQPMMDNMQKGTFTMDQFATMMQPAQMKQFMDNFFAFMPSESKQMLDQMNANLVETMKQMSQMGNGSYASMKNNWNQMPGMNFMQNSNNVWDMYSQMRSMMGGMISPLTKLMESNTTVQDMMQWDTLSQMIAELNVKNTQLQYMMYEAGVKAMEEMAMNQTSKMQAGESITSTMKMYQEFLALGDKHFTTLFESDAYSELMTETSSLQMKVQIAMDKQMEKMFFAHMPIATRTEMDEVYKSLYDIKKMVRTLEKMMGINGSATTNEPTATASTAKKATAVKKAPVTKKVAKPVTTKKVVAKKATTRNK